MFCSEVHGYLKDRETDLLSLVEVLDEELDDEEDDIFLLLEELEKVGHMYYELQEISFSNFKKRTFTNPVILYL